MCLFPGQMYSCGSCSFIDQRDCLGGCPTANNPSLYVTDCTGACVLQKSAKVLDRCGVCDGDGTSCLDCLGVVNGTAELDGCDVCNGTGTTCGLVVRRLEPEVLPNSGKAFFDVIGAGLTSGLVWIEINTSGISPSDIVVVIPNQRLRVYVRTVFSLSEDFRTSLPIRISVVGSSSSVSTVIRFYKPTSFISSVSLDRVFLNVAATLNFMGSNFYTFYDGMAKCVFATTPRTFTDLRIISSQMAQCDAPVLSRSISLDYVVVYSIPPPGKSEGPWREDLGIPFRTKQNITLVYYARGPAVTSAMLSNDASTILVNFDEKVDTNPSSDLKVYRSCDDVFVTDGSNGLPALVRPGFPQDCRVRFNGRSAAFISLDPRVMSTFFSSPSITIRESILFTFDAAFSDSSTGSFKVANPEFPPRPTIIMQGPENIPSCGAISIDLSQSFTGGGDSFANAQFSIISRTVGVLLPNLADTLAVQRSTFLAQKTPFTLQASLLTPAAYSVNISLQNIFGIASNATRTVKILDSAIFPVVTVMSPREKIKPDTAIQLLARVENAAGCATASIPTPSITWSFLNGTNGFSYRIPPSQSTRFSLNIPPLVLPPASRFFFQLLVASTDGMLGSTVVSIETGEERITVTAGGRMMFPTSNVKLRGSFLNDAFPVTDLSIFGFQWSCFSAFKPCSSVGTSSLQSAGQTLSPDFSGMLRAGDYQFFLTVRNLNTGAVGVSDPVYLSLVNENIPVLSLSIKEAPQSFLLSGITVQTRLDPASVSNRSSLQYQWDSLMSCGGSSGSFTPLNLTPALGGVKAPDLRLPSRVLITGASYCIGVTVTDSVTRLNSTASINFRVGDEPRGGYCIATSAQVGIEFATSFRFACSGWIAESTPLLYSWEVRSTSSQTWTAVGSPGFSPAFSSVFAKGSYQIRATIRDRFGVRNSVPQIMSITVVGGSRSSILRRNSGPVHLLGRQATASSPAFSYLTEVAIPAFSAFGDAEAAMSIMASLSLSLFDAGYTQTARSDLRAALVGFFNTVTSSGLVYLDDQAGPLLISTLSSLVNSTAVAPASSFTTSQIGALATSLYQIVTGVIQNIKPLGRCLGDADVSNTIGVFSNALQTFAPSEYNSALSGSILQSISAINSCYVDSLSCGQPSKIINTSDLYIEFGVDRIQTTTGMSCSVTYRSSDVQALFDDRGCLRLSCGTVMSARSLFDIQTSIFEDLSDVVPFFTVVGSNGGPIDWPAGSRVTASIPMSSRFLAVLSEIQWETVASRLACGVFTPSVTGPLMTLRTGGCSLQALNRTQASCSCDRSGYFVIGLMAIPSTTAVGGGTGSSSDVNVIPSPTSDVTDSNVPTPTQEASQGVSPGPNVGVILGALFGSLAFVALAAVGGYLLWKWYQTKQDAKKKVSPDQQSDDNASAINEDEDEDGIEVFMLPPPEDQTRSASAKPIAAQHRGSMPSEQPVQPQQVGAPQPPLQAAIDTRRAYAEPPSNATAPVPIVPHQRVYLPPESMLLNRATMAPTLYSPQQRVMTSGESYVEYVPEVPTSAYPIDYSAGPVVVNQYGGYPEDNSQGGYPSNMGAGPPTQNQWQM
ncbi:hypothetical protein HDU67_006241 [Dinochytrium kinnereticum]|nr:hypothetical protein HDU67_006241 [Dinochytrium kinnereticum]